MGRVHGEAPIRSNRGLRARYVDVNPLASDVVINLIHAHTLLSDELGRRIRPHGLSLTGLRVLIILHLGARPMRPQEIADRLRLTPGTVTGLVDSLQRTGAVARHRHPEDGRGSLVALTDGGQHLLDVVWPIEFAAEKAVVAQLTVEEQDMLVELLGRVQRALLDLASERASDA